METGRPCPFSSSFSSPTEGRKDIFLSYFSQIQARVFLFGLKERNVQMYLHEMCKSFVRSSALFIQPPWPIWRFEADPNRVPSRGAKHNSGTIIHWLCNASGPL